MFRSLIQTDTYDCYCSSYEHLIMKLNHLPPSINKEWLCTKLSQTMEQLLSEQLSFMELNCNNIEDCDNSEDCSNSDTYTPTSCSDDTINSGSSNSSEPIDLDSSCSSNVSLIDSPEDDSDTSQDAIWLPSSIDQMKQYVTTKTVNKRDDIPILRFFIPIGQIKTLKKSSPKIPKQLTMLEPDENNNSYVHEPTNADTNVQLLASKGNEMERIILPTNVKSLVDFKLKRRFNRVMTLLKIKGKKSNEKSIQTVDSVDCIHTNGEDNVNNIPLNQAMSPINSTTETIGNELDIEVKSCIDLIDSGIADTSSISSLNSLYNYSPICDNFDSESDYTPDMDELSIFNYGQHEGEREHEKVDVSTSKKTNLRKMSNRISKMVSSIAHGDKNRNQSDANYNDTAICNDSQCKHSHWIESIEEAYDNYWKQLDEPIKP
ncbi:hypothetical protein BLOT_011604 [Blomia tropicalis]|nr:hypothetical protein BLOT_011604 [Blomia tropicalis]